MGSKSNLVSGCGFKGRCNNRERRPEVQTQGHRQIIAKTHASFRQCGRFSALFGFPSSDHQRLFLRICHQGVQLLLDGVIDYLPNPLEVPNFALDTAKDEEKVISTSIHGIERVSMALVFMV